MLAVSHCTEDIHKIVGSAAPREYGNAPVVGWSGCHVFSCVGDIDIVGKIYLWFSVNPLEDMSHTRDCQSSISQVQLAIEKRLNRSLTFQPVECEMDKM